MMNSIVVQKGKFGTDRALAVSCTLFSFRGVNKLCWGVFERALHSIRITSHQASTRWLRVQLSLTP